MYQYLTAPIRNKPVQTTCRPPPPVLRTLVVETPPRLWTLAGPAVVFSPSHIIKCYFSSRTRCSSVLLYALGSSVLSCHPSRLLLMDLNISFRPLINFLIRHRVSNANSHSCTTPEQHIYVFITIHLIFNKIYHDYNNI